ncbi:MAG: caspase family protein [Bacteroidaceae bacterium]|nr:caspase family protein [Bacteroidaceae bacterium]
MKRILFTAILICIGFCTAAKAENVKIHAIAFCNTDDESIGESCLNDQRRFVEQLGIIEVATGCEVDWYNVYTGKECSKPNLESAVSGLRCNPNDVIFFYYTGHGVHAKADPADGWLPQMCLNYKSYEQDKFVPVTWVRDKLAQKGARLCIILTDCCNNEADWVSVKGLVASDGREPNTDDINAQKLRKLFFESQGTVIATSSKRGQVSFGPKEGGCFSMAFWDEIYNIEYKNGTADWEALMKATKKGTLASTNGDQEPVYNVSLNTLSNSNTTVVPTPTNPAPVVISVGDNELSGVFKQIVNPIYSHTERLNMVNGIVNRYFENETQVIMLGGNLTTKVGVKNISQYLKALALSKTVKGINVVHATKTSGGKYNYLEISEIR